MDFIIKRSPYTSLVSNLFFPLHERLKQHDSVAVRKQMEITQWWDKDRLYDFQLSRLRSFLSRVQTRVPYYQQLFTELDFNAASIQSLTDLERLPRLNKSIIRANLEALKSSQAQDLARFNTGGSSGEPLIFFIGKRRISHDIAAKWRATRWWNVDIGDPEIVIWGSPIELGAQDRLRRIRDRILKTKLLPAFEMSEQKLDQFLAEIRIMRPKMLFGYPSALSHIARHAEAKGQRMDDLGIRVAFVTSERLYDEQRQQISKIFNCPVANGYGARDAGFIAHECPQGGMHITAEDILVEIVDTQGNTLPPGQAGEIVVTHFATDDFPFIRYQTGDMGVLDSQACACGRGLPLIREIQGRSTDFVVTQDGTVMHGLALIYILRDLPQVDAFKIIQESKNLTTVWLVTKTNLDSELVRRIEQAFKARLGQKVNILVERVAQIPPEKSGKFRYVMSRVTTH
ncbi:phenylacetate-CoA ligase [Nitrosomonas cryotolerans]|uniref:Phenylacetate-CoA ligase n=2 Tax=Nitrosomonas cryotolerans TaxID=44575 RepID=A0A1N6HZ15_9PROT|nr:AMP-binding protein [Nitrosomonas cryotolerans]SFP68598.1 phenylacetate-CoA ligase [Nitrosomonas cryotolerans]SIO24899.1 phenylacetate-CoA ligase [Nitrosomonas cryotolerans ATCC 49181]